MTRYAFVFIILLLTACWNNNNKQDLASTDGSHKDSLLQISTETTFLDTSRMEMYFNVKNPIVFADTAYVYIKADSSSEVLAKLNFNTALDIVNPGDYWHGWYEVNLNKKKGYIPTTSVATHKFTTTIKGKELNYFLVTSYSPKYNPNMQGFTVYKYDVLRKQYIDTFSVPNTRADIVKELNHVAWKNADLLLYAKQIDAYCGGGETELYLIDANGSFSELFAIYNYANDGEEGGGSYSSVAFPKNVETDTIIYNRNIEEAVYTKKGKPVKNKDGSYKMKTVNDTTKYYCWDGNALKMVKVKINN